VSECQILLSKELDSLRTQEENELENATIHQLQLNRTLEILLTLLPQEILDTQLTTEDDLSVGAEASTLDVDHFHQADRDLCETASHDQVPLSTEDDSPESLLSLGALLERCFLTQFPTESSLVPLGKGSSPEVCIRLAVTFSFLSLLVSSITCLLFLIALISRWR
jgi:hypothetical protein